jgi:hypothetical protein
MARNIIVHDVSQEYWYIKKQKCSCGGQFDPQGQKLLVKDGESVDLIEAVCNVCKNQKDFFFDISNFHGVERSIKQAALIEKMQKADNGDLYAFALELTLSPVGKAINTIVNLGKQGDILALDWINDALNRAKDEIQTLQGKDKA